MGKKKKKERKNRDYLMWLIPLVMVVFLALEAAGLYYMTTYYTKFTENDTAETADYETGDTETAAEAEISETVTESENQEETTAAADTKRDWDGEFYGTDEGNNTFTITFSCSFATVYEVQRYNTASLTWETVNTLFPNDPDATDGGTETAYGTGTAGTGSILEDGTGMYVTPQLEPFLEVRYRVLAEDAESYAISATLICETKECAISAVVWPVKNLTAYTTSSGYTIAGAVETLEAYLVVDEADGRFGVEVSGEIWYIDSDYCMINLPDYVGELCEYDITNSYSSIYAIDGYAMPGLTGTVLTGYENVSQEGNEYLVPFLYPAAKKLVVAAEAAKEKGYHLKIYDTYRPNEATKYMYSLASSILDDYIPETGDTMTYREAMLGNTSYSLSNFFAKNRSMHNLGIATDLTLVDESTGKEAVMQTQMHDVSSGSAVGENNDMANLLQQIMVDAGFGTLSSEWWHFQDNEARDSLDLPTLSGGVSGLQQ